METILIQFSLVLYRVQLKEWVESAEAFSQIFKMGGEVQNKTTLCDFGNLALICGKEEIYFSRWV